MKPYYEHAGITIYHGDCMEILPQLPCNSFHVTITDIPYGEVNRNSNGLRNLDKGIADICNFDVQQFAVEIDRLTCGSVYVFCGSSQLSVLDQYWRDAGYSRRCLVWEKTNPMPLNGQHIWLSGIEHISFCKKPRATFNGFCRNTVLRYPSGDSAIHPTEKPIGLIRELLSVSTQPGERIIDPCVGSGTSLRAAKDVGLSAVGIEIEERYCEIAAKRLEQGVLEFTG